MSQTIGRAWRALRDRFAAAGIGTAALDARLLTRHVLGLDETALILAEAAPVPDEKSQALEALVSRRLSGEPIARILGQQEFYGFSFGLNAATLIPRPETEMLVDFGLEALSGKPAPAILDLGTGTGCIVLSLLATLPDAAGTGTDIAPDALDQAQRNAESLGVAGRFSAVHSDWFSALGEQRFDLIVSNPPYIARAVIQTLEPGVKSFDPMLALDGGADGLEPYRIIAAQGQEFLGSDGVLALEIGFDQGHIVKHLLKERGWRDVRVMQDLAGHDRMVTARAQK